MQPTAQAVGKSGQQTSPSGAKDKFSRTLPKGCKSSPEITAGFRDPVAEMPVSGRYHKSEELLLINFEQRAGVQRNAAWQTFAVRVGFESARSFVAMLIQTDRFGTPIAKSMLHTPGADSGQFPTQGRLEGYRGHPRSSALGGCF
jgi:hypothetical protein